MRWTRDRSVSRRARLGAAVAVCLALGAVFAPASVAADSAAVSCASETSDWQLRDVDELAADFFPHLFASYPFADADAFAAEISAVSDKNGDGWVCARVSGGDDLNPKSHWYRLGWEIPLKGGVPEPIHFLRARDNLVK